MTRKWSSTDSQDVVSEDGSPFYDLLTDTIVSATLIPILFSFHCSEVPWLFLYMLTYLAPTLQYVQRLYSDSMPFCSFMMNYDCNMDNNQNTWCQYSVPVGSFQRQTFWWPGENMWCHSSKYLICLGNILIACLLFSHAQCFPVHGRITLNMSGLELCFPVQ